MTRDLMILAAVVGMGTMASAAYAHHSHPYFYDQCTSVTIEGAVDSVRWKDPHTLVVIRLADGATYTVDWNGLSALTNRRIFDPAKAALVVGARVVVTGHPIRSAEGIRKFFPDFNDDVSPNIVDPRSIRRMDDSFSWAMPPVSNPPDCGRK